VGSSAAGKATCEEMRTAADAVDKVGNERAVNPNDLMAFLREIMSKKFQSISKRYKKFNTMTVVIEFNSN
jgi:hypothetical protein